MNTRNLSRLKHYVFLLNVLLGIGLATNAFGGKPTDNEGKPIGNGFPSGPHFNLNFNAKSENFSCPPPSYYFRITEANDGLHSVGDLVESCPEGNVCELTDTQIFGNVIFIPRVQDGDPITVTMESGKKGPKSQPDATKLEVTDWCTESFPDDGVSTPPLGDGASLRLPKNDDGYAVYARLAGKPGANEEERTFSTVPSLVLVEDESGNDLILLGLVDSSGVFNPEGELLKRTDDSKKGKGVTKATDISALFNWSGSVCYLQEDADLYCIEDNVDVCYDLGLCCIDADYSADGVYEHCDPLSDVGIDDPLACPQILDHHEEFLGEPYISVDARCREYVNEWVFNISDYVNVLWNIDTTGAYHIQIRFYPLPLN